MGCRVEEQAAGAVWDTLLACRRYLREPGVPPEATVALFRAEGKWSFSSEGPVAGADAQILVPLADPPAAPTGETGTWYDPGLQQSGASPFVHRGGPTVAPEVLAVLRLYLPVLLGGFRARRGGGVFVVAHLAQTLDGRIACRNGHSQWISNEANLRHAHRLRALNDAVVVGSRTVVSDDPQLTVRHVTGEHPRRVVLNGSASLLQGSGSYQLFDEPGSTLLCRRGAMEDMNGDLADHRHVRVAPVEADEPLLSPDVVCKALAREDLSSVFLEGGARTVSRFFEDRRIDLLHLHVAPLILGSGVESFRLPEIARIEDGRRLQCTHFELDGEILLECTETETA